MKTKDRFVTLKLSSLAMAMALSAAKQDGKDVEWAEKNWNKFIPAAEAIADSSLNVYDETANQAKDIATEFYYH